MSINLNERLKMLWRTIQNDYKAKAHSFGVKYKNVKILNELFPISSLAIEFYTESNPKVIEKNLILEYVNKFGEVPPFNSAIPK
jgi:hypothetical protein